MFCDEGGLPDAHARGSIKSEDEQINNICASCPQIILYASLK
jgi:hypothetical protein